MDSICRVILTRELTKVSIGDVNTTSSNRAVKQGVSPEDASYFIGRTYLSIVQDAERNSRDPARFDKLIQEQTPGGLNEQVSYSFHSPFNILSLLSHSVSSPRCAFAVITQPGTARGI